MKGTRPLDSSEIRIARLHVFTEDLQPWSKQKTIDGTIKAFAYGTNREQCDQIVYNIVSYTRTLSRMRRTQCSGFIDREH